MNLWRLFQWRLIAIAGILMAGTVAWAQGQNGSPMPPKKPATKATSKADPKTNKAAGAKKIQPLSLRGINKMRRSIVSTDDIVGAAQDKGIDFAVTPLIQTQLRKLGFEPDQIAAIKACHGIEPLPPILAGQFLRMEPEERAKTLADFVKINKQCGADLPSVESAHVTLWAAKSVQPTFLADIARAEKLLETKFHEPIRSGVDKRTTHVVIIKTRAEYDKWVRALYDVIEFDFPTPAAKDQALKGALKSQWLVGENYAAFCLESTPVASVHRSLATDLGYMYFLQLSEISTAGPLATGFANVVEAALAGSPATTISRTEYGAEDRQIGADRRTWLQIVQSRMAAHQDTPLAELLELDTSKMTLPNYAEAWSLVDFLARAIGPNSVNWSWPFERSILR